LSYFNATSERAVTRFFHAMVFVGNGVLDLTRLPLRLMEVTFGHSAELRPLFAAMKFRPIVQGIVCYRLAWPDVVRALAPRVPGNGILKLVDLHGCSAQVGIAELASAVHSNWNSRAVNLDLSDNPFADITPFCAALADARGCVFPVPAADGVRHGERGLADRIAARE
jgi:hypothetical protein